VVGKLSGHSSSDMFTPQPSSPLPYCEHEGLGSPFLIIEKLKFPTAEWTDIAKVDSTSLITKNRYLRCRLYGISENHGIMQKTIVAIHKPKSEKWEVLICCPEKNQVLRWRLPKRTSFKKYLLCVSLYECGKYEISSWNSVSIELYWNHLEFDCSPNSNTPQAQNVTPKKNNNPRPSITCWAPRSPPRKTRSSRRAPRQQATTSTSLPAFPLSSPQTSPTSFPAIYATSLPIFPTEDSTVLLSTSTPTGNDTLNEITPKFLGDTPTIPDPDYCYYENNNRNLLTSFDFDEDGYEEQWGGIAERLPTSE